MFWNSWYITLVPIWLQLCWSPTCLLSAIRGSQIFTLMFICEYFRTHGHIKHYATMTQAVWIFKTVFPLASVNVNKVKRIDICNKSSVIRFLGWIMTRLRYICEHSIHKTFLFCNVFWVWNLLTSPIPHTALRFQHHSNIFILFEVEVFRMDLKDRVVHSNLLAVFWNSISYMNHKHHDQ